MVAKMLSKNIMTAYHIIDDTAYGSPPELVIGPAKPDPLAGTTDVTE
jgi:hypothetical protein